MAHTSCLHSWIEIAASTVCLTVGSASAAQGFTLYEDRSLWEAAISDFEVITEKFESVPEQHLLDGTVLTLPSGITLTAEAPGSFVAGSILQGFDAFDNNQIVLGDFDPGDALALSFPVPAIGFGFDYLDVDLGDVQLLVQVDGLEGVDAIAVPPGADGSALTADFFGIVADQPFSEITLSLATGPSETWDLDNVSLAADTLNASVPEPGMVVALIGFVLGGFCQKSRLSRN